MAPKNTLIVLPHYSCVCVFFLRSIFFCFSVCFKDNLYEISLDRRDFDTKSKTDRGKSVETCFYFWNVAIPLPLPPPCQLDLYGQNDFLSWIATQFQSDRIFTASISYRMALFLSKKLTFSGGPHIHDPSEPPRASGIPLDLGHCVVSSKMSSSSNTSESRRQFLSSTLGPLTACVTMGVAHNDDYYYHLSNHSQPG